MGPCIQPRPRFTGGNGNSGRLSNWARGRAVVQPRRGSFPRPSLSPPHTRSLVSPNCDAAVPHCLAPVSWLFVGSSPVPLLPCALDRELTGAAPGSLPSLCSALHPGPGPEPTPGAGGEEGRFLGVALVKLGTALGRLLRPRVCRLEALLGPGLGEWECPARPNFVADLNAQVYFHFYFLQMYV